MNILIQICFFFFFKIKIFNNIDFPIIYITIFKNFLNIGNNEKNFFYINLVYITMDAYKLKFVTMVFFNSVIGIICKHLPSYQ